MNDKIIDKIKKCLALAKSSNANLHHGVNGEQGPARIGRQA